MERRFIQLPEDTEPRYARPGFNLMKPTAFSDGDISAQVTPTDYAIPKDEEHFQILLWWAYRLGVRDGALEVLAGVDDIRQFAAETAKEGFNAAYAYAKRNAERSEDG